MEALDGAPVHTRRALFGTLVDALGANSLAIMASLLLRRASAIAEQPEGAGAKLGEDAVSSIEFVHQICHFGGAQAQVRR